jgi:hypothetical protein
VAPVKGKFKEEMKYAVCLVDGRWRNVRISMFVNDGAYRKK